MDTESRAPAFQPADPPHEGEAPASQPHAPVPNRPTAVPECPISAANCPLSSRFLSHDADPLTPESGEMGRSGTQNANILSPKQTMAIPIVAASPSITAGAKASGVGRSTLNRWMQDPAFRAELERSRQSAAELAYSEIQALSLKSVDALAALLQDPNPNVRVAAVRTSLHHLRKIETDRNIQQRLDVLSNAFDLVREQR